MNTLFLIPAILLLYIMIQMFVKAEKQNSSFSIEGKNSMTSIPKPKKLRNTSFSYSSLYSLNTLSKKFPSIRKDSNIWKKELDQKY